jgi:heme-degrading monooxygenase HmoA
MPVHGPFPTRKGESPMFARILEVTPKMERREELIKVVRQEVIPILKKQPGFLELLPFVPEVTGEKVIAITLWNEKHEAERYVKEALPKVEQILKPYMAASILFRSYHVETTLCEHLVEMLTAAV